MKTHSNFFLTLIFLQAGGLIVPSATTGDRGSIIPVAGRSNKTEVLTAEAKSMEPFRRRGADQAIGAVSRSSSTASLLEDEECLVASLREKVTNLTRERDEANLEATLQKTVKAAQVQQHAQNLRDQRALAQKRERYIILITAATTAAVTTAICHAGQIVDFFKPKK